MFEKYLRYLKNSRVEKLKRYWLTVAFFVGFLIDNITLNRVDQVFDNFVLSSYVFIAGGSLFFLYASTAGRVVKEEWQPYFLKYSPLAVQFAFGGLLSGILIFYSRSGSLFQSWPFLLLILVVIVGNETLKRRAQRLIFNLVILYIGVFSYIALLIPVVTGIMNAFIFILSGIIALIAMYGFLNLLARVVPNFIAHNTKAIVFSLGVSFVSLNFLYFTNIIPPIPLSLKEVGIYHKVVHADEGGYFLTYEKGEWWQFFKDSDTTYHYKSGDAVYCFASVFAPTRLSTTVFHRWEFYDPKNKEWIFHDRIPYEIDGGRDGGYRGFTLIRSVRDGVWRCTVETERKQVLGREKFRIESGIPSAFVTRFE